MVILNDVVPIDFNKSKKLLWKILDKKIIKILDDVFYNNENREKYITYIHRKMKEEYKEILDDNHFLFLIMNNRYCTHIFKRGRMEGMVCGAKIEINTTSKYLCSRHNRIYKPKSRNYTLEKPRCNYIKNNSERCKHMTNNLKTYCYIHNKYSKDDKIEKENQINKLKYLRKILFKNKYRYKNKYYDEYKNKKCRMIYRMDKNMRYNFLYDNKINNKYINIYENRNNFILKINDIT